jgi:hypothetical protein
LWIGRHLVLGKYVGNEFAKVSAIFAESMGVKHIEHGRSGALDDGNTREQCRRKLSGRIKFAGEGSDVRLFATTASNSGRPVISLG